ncbi:MAG: histidine phosphatase family protein [Chloroflexi bacterium]|nr:histidine phosphatase family protein [Chloroflexota bacterium]
MSARRRPVVELYLLRHADAGDPEAWPGDDADRPLSGRGRRQAEALATFLADRGFAPGAILSSPLARARQTADILGQRLGVPVVIEARLADDLDAAGLEAILDDAGRPAAPVLVGHDPTFSSIAAELVGAPRLAMKKGALARIDVSGSMVDGDAVLRWLIPPDALTGR